MENTTPHTPREKRSFFSGVLFLGLSNILVKVIGLLCKIPLSAYLGDEGMGYFNSAYQIYTWLYMLSTAGLPVAVTILVAEGRSGGRAGEVRCIWHVALLLLAVVGGVGALGLFFGAGALSAWIGTGGARYALAALAPTLFFVCVGCALRGYLQGFQQLAPSAMAQVLAAGGKLFCGVGFAAYARAAGYALPVVAAMAVAGIGIGEGVALLYLAIALVWYRHRGRLTVAPGPCAELPAAGGWRTWLVRLLRIAVPVTISAMVMSLSGMIDLVLVQRRLQAVGYTPEAATAFYGNYTTLAVPLFNLPPALIYPLISAMVPLLSQATGAGDMAKAKRLIHAVLRLSVLVAMPCALGMAVFSRAILSLFFPAAMVARAAPLLSVLSPGVLLLALVSVANGALQACGHPTRPIYAMLAGAVVKLVADYVLLGVPQIGVYAVPLGTVLCYLAAFCIHILQLAQCLQVSLSPVRLLLRPFLASLLSVGGAVAVYQWLGGAGAGAWPFLLALPVAVLLYGAAVLGSHAVGAEELALLPGGKWLCRIFFRDRRETGHF